MKNDDSMQSGNIESSGIDNNTNFITKNQQLKILVVSGFPSTSCGVEVIDKFERFGNIRAVSDAHTNDPQKTYMITFCDYKEAEAARNELKTDNMSFSGHKLELVL